MKQKLIDVLLWLVFMAATMALLLKIIIYNGGYVL